MQNLHFLCQTLIVFAKAVQFCRISFLTPLRFSRAKRLNLKPLSFQLSACYSKLLGYAALRCARLIKPINGACFKLVGIGSSMLSHWVPLSWTGVKYPNVREQARSSVRLRSCLVYDIEALAIPPFLAGCGCRTYAAIFSFMAGVMPPMPIFGRSLL